MKTQQKEVPQQIPTYLTSFEVRDTFKLSLSRIVQLRKEGVLRAYTLGGRKLLFRLDEVQAALVECKL